MLLAFLPAAVIGAFAHSFIKAQLFRPEIVCIALIAGGLVLLAVDELQLEARADDVYEITPLMALKIGFFQVISPWCRASRAPARPSSARC